MIFERSVTNISYHPAIWKDTHAHMHAHTRIYTPLPHVRMLACARTCTQAHAQQPDRVLLNYLSAAPSDAVGTGNCIVVDKLENGLGQTGCNFRRIIVQGRAIVHAAQHVSTDGWVVYIAGNTGARKPGQRIGECPSACVDEDL